MTNEVAPVLTPQLNTEAILSAAKKTDAGVHLVSMLRDDVLIGDFQDAVVGVVRAVIASQAEEIERLKAEVQALKAILGDAEELLYIAANALSKMRLTGHGSDCTLSHEVRMFALNFSPESRDGPGALQVNGNGRHMGVQRALRATLREEASDGEGISFVVPPPLPGPNARATDLKKSIRVVVESNISSPAQRRDVALALWRDVDRLAAESEARRAALHKIVDAADSPAADGGEIWYAEAVSGPIDAARAALQTSTGKEQA